MVGFGQKIDLALERAKHMCYKFALFSGSVIKQEEYLFLERFVGCQYFLLDGLIIPYL
jgi:hypothetical protein